MIIYKTKEECISGINTLKAIGLEPQPWQLEQLAKFEAKEASQQHSTTPIWDTLQAHYPYGKMPQEKIDCVESTVEQLLQDGEKAEEPGLLLGKIQCGKTDTFEDIIGLSFDRGVDIAIVLTKGTKALVNQTIMRMKKDYQWFKASDNLDQSQTITIYDIMEIGKSGLKQARVESSKTVIVCKKQAQNMERLINLFEQKSTFLKKKKVIIVDDEADFASRNYYSVNRVTQTNEDGKAIAHTSDLKMAKISQQIDDFRQIPEFCRYLQVTATPYCLYLQPDGELNLDGNVVKPFKPRFTSLVPTHAAYMGGHQYFVESADPDSMYSHLYHQLDQKCIDVLGHEDKRYINSTVSSGNIYRLTYSLMSYFMATAVRRIQCRAEGKDYKTSAIIHVEIDKKNHDWQRRIVNRLIDSIKAAVLEDDRSDLRVWLAMDSIYKDFQASTEKGRNEGLISVEVPSHDEVLEEMQRIFNPSLNNYHVQMVNSDEEVDTLLDEESGELRLDCAANIFIGGNILDRGVTIKNMLCFFYGRNPKKFQQDTVLQHARMYGARSKEDMAVMRLHTTPEIYKILVRMHELDEQLRQWFIEGKDKLEPNAVFVGYDKNIKPCAASKIKASNALMIKPQKRILPIGFWTGSKTAISKTVAEIDKLITTAPNYSKKDIDGFFEMDKDTVVEIIKKIQTTYIYNEIKQNLDRKNDLQELLCALEYCCDKSGGKVLVLHRTDRNMSRLKENGSFSGAPDNGHTDLRPAREKATDTPVVMLFRQNGDVIKSEDGENIGWNGAPFYWPVLLTQANINSVMFSFDQKAKEEKPLPISNEEILGDINPEEVLFLTYKGDLEAHFGKEGEDETSVETRGLKQSTAHLYIEKDENGNWALNPDVEIDYEHYHGLYSRNNDIFPFILRPYKYMCLRNGRDARADAMLLELEDTKNWGVWTETTFSKDGKTLLDRDGAEKALIRVNDTILGKDLGEQEFADETITQWVIGIITKKVIKFIKSRVKSNIEALEDEVSITCDDESGKKILNLATTQHIFNQILQGRKKQEIREINPTNIDKFIEMDEEGFEITDEDGVSLPIKYDAIRFYVGINKDRGSALIEVKNAYVEDFKDENGELITYEYAIDSTNVEHPTWAKSQVVYEFGEILETDTKQKTKH